jgi:hypothetical protein
MMSSVVSQAREDKGEWVQHYLPNYLNHQAAAISGAASAAGGTLGGVFLCALHKHNKLEPIKPTTKKVSEADFEQEVLAKSVPIDEVSSFVKVHNVGTTTLLDKVAIRVYTGDWIFSDLNNTLRKFGCKIDDLSQWKTVTLALQNAIKQFPMPFEGRVLYRGQVSLFGVSYVVGDVVSWPAFSSVTTNR